MSQGRNANVSSQARMNQYYPIAPHWMTDHEAIFPWKLHDVSDQKKPYHGKHTSFVRQLDAWFWGVKSSWEMNSKLRFQAHPSCATGPGNQFLVGHFLITKATPLRIMGSQNWWFGDPRPLLYTSKTLYSRVQWFLGPVILRILGF